MTEEEKKTITREKHPGRVAQGHKLAALMKKRKEEILRNKEQSTEQSIVQSKEQSSVQSTEQSAVQPTGQSNNTYVYGVGMLAILAIAACVFFAYNTSQAKNKLQYSLQNSLQYSLQNNQIILVFMALACLLSLPLVLVYFLHITLPRLKIKNSSMKNRINHQNESHMP